MLYLLDKDAKTVKWNGIPLHEASSAVVKEETNGDFYLTVHYPITDSGIYQLIKEDMLIKAPTPVLGPQLFRIKKPVENDDSLDITAYHISDDVMQRSIRPVSVVGQGCAMALSQMVQNAKTDLGTFSFTSDIMDSRTFNTTETETLYTVLMDGKHSIVGTWEGELVRDNFALTIKRNRGADRGVVITTHKNLKSYQRTKNSQSVVTRIHARSTFRAEGAETDTVLTVTVDSPLIGNYPYINEKEYENNDAKTIDELKKWAEAKFTNEGIDKVSDAIEIEAYELDGQVIHLGDTVNIKSIKHDVDLYKKAIAYEYNALTEEYISITFDDKPGVGGSGVSSGVSNAADVILGVNKTAQEVAIERAVRNANQAFDAEFEKQKIAIEDGLEKVKSEAEVYANEIATKVESNVREDITNARAIADQATELGNKLVEDFDNLEISGVNLALGTGSTKHIKADGSVNYLWQLANSLSDYGLREGQKMSISAELSPVGSKAQKFKLWADEYLAFFEHNTKVNGKLSVNELGLVGGSFIQDNPKWSYTPPNTSSSEAQILVIRGLLRNYIVSGNKDFLETAEFLTDGLLNYYYPSPKIPTEPDPKWIPHWMVNVNGPFRSREWRIDGVANFVDGKATFESPEVIRVWSVRAKEATLQYDWSPDAPIVGTEYKIKNTNVLWGQSKVEIELEENYSGQALVVYTAETGRIIEVGEKCEAYPVWRPLEKGEIACAVDTLPWAIDIFQLWFEITGDERWKMAIASTKSAIVEASAVTNIEYYLKAGKDSESVLINGVISFSDRTPIENYTNENGRIKIEYAESSGEASIGTWVGDKVEFSNSRWISVKVGSEKPLKVKIVIDEESTYNPDKRWFSDIHLSGNGMETFDLYPSDFYRSDRVVWGSGYGKTTEGGAINSGQSSVSKETIIDAGKEVTRLTLVKGDEGGWLGWAQFMLGIWDYHLPFDLRYKTDDEVNFVINANSTAHTLKLPKTNGEYSTITITGDSFDIPFTGDSYDSFVIEAVSQTSIIYIDYIGFIDKFDKNYLTNVSFRYSEPESATVYLEYIKPEPTRTPLKYAPYLMPFDFHLINYQFTALRGAIYSGYQAPWVYQEKVFPDVEEAVKENLQFLNDSQDAFFELQGQDGFFAPIYWWNYRDDYGDNEPDTFGIEGNWGKVWGGFQYRTISDVARVFIKDPTNQLAHDIFIRFLRAMENYWTDPIGNFPTAFNAGEPPHRDQLDAQMVSNFLRSLIYGWECSILTDEERALIKRLANKAFEFLEHYRIPVGLFESAVEGTWSPDKANETWFGYWGGELLDLLALAQTSNLFNEDESTISTLDNTTIQFYLNPPNAALFEEPVSVKAGKFSKTFRVTSELSSLILSGQKLGISLLNDSGSLVSVKYLKIEFGDKPTGYSKAIEETVLYSQFSKIEKTIKGFKQTVQNTKADKTTVTQLADLWETTTELVDGHTSQIRSMGIDINLRVKKDELISQINLSPDTILIESEKISLKGKTLAEEILAIDGKFSTLFVADGTFAKLNSTIIGTKAISGGQIDFDKAFFDGLTANEAYLKQLFAQKVFSTSVQTVSLSANQITGGLIKATSGAMDINLDNAGILFREDAKIEFKSENNTLFRTKNGTSAFIHFRDDSYNGVYTAMGVNADNTGTQNDYASGRFAGVRVIRTNPNHYSGQTVDEIQLVADTVNFRHQYGVNNDFLRIKWDGGSRIDLIQFLRAVSNYLGISLV